MEEPEGWKSEEYTRSNKRARTFVSTTETPKSSKQTIRILTIDGGGLSSIIPVTILEKIEEQLQFEHPDQQIHLARYFDIMAATSTSSILALGLSAHLSAESIARLYLENPHKLFCPSPSSLEGQPFYDAQVLENTLYELFGGKWLNEAASHVLITADNLRQKCAYLFDSKQAQRPSHNFKIKDVARAACARINDFPTVTIKDEKGLDNHTFADGEEYAYDPTFEAIKAAEKEYPGCDLFIVSLGTGEVSRQFGDLILSRGDTIPGAGFPLESRRHQKDRHLGYLDYIKKSFKKQGRKVKSIRLQVPIDSSLSHDPDINSLKSLRDAGLSFTNSQHKKYKKYEKLLKHLKKLKTTEKSHQSMSSSEERMSSPIPATEPLSNMRYWKKISNRVPSHILPGRPKTFIESSLKGSSQSYLTLLWNCLHKEGQTIVSASVAGMGGIGKTSLALQYAYEALDNKAYEHIYWIYSETLDNLIAGYKCIVRKLKISLNEESIIDDFKDQMDERSNYLLIYDNVPDSRFLDDKIPQSNGHILITSRCQEGWKQATLILDVFSKEDANISISEQLSEEQPESYKSKSFLNLGSITVYWKKISAIIFIIMLMTPFFFVSSLAFLPYVDAPIFSSQMIETHHQTYIEKPYINSTAIALPIPSFLHYTNSATISYSNESLNNAECEIEWSDTASEAIVLKEPLKILSSKVGLEYVSHTWGPPFNRCLTRNLPPFNDYRNYIESVPVASNKSYVAQLGDKLHLEYIPNQFLMDVSYRQVSITGLGGIGKSYLALAYATFANTHKLYEVIQWIKAEEKASIFQTYRSLIGRLGKFVNSEDEESVLICLEDTLEGKKALLIYDNVPNKEFLQGILPSTGHIIVTSRFREEGGWTDSLPLKGFTLEEAVGYLFRRTKFIQDNFNFILAEKLVEEMDCLPLALAVASSYMRIEKCNFEKYLEQFKENSVKLLNYSGTKNEFSLPVVVTWKITMDTLSPLSNKLMSYFAYFPPDEIPISLFRETSYYDSDQIENAIKDLFLYSMIDRTSEYVSVHRLVQTVERIKYENPLKARNETAEDILDDLFLLFIEKAPILFKTDFNNRDINEKAFSYIPSLASLIEHSKRLKIENFNYWRVIWIRRFLTHALDEFMFFKYITGSFPFVRYDKPLVAAPIDKRIKLQEYWYKYSSPKQACEAPENYESLQWILGIVEEAHPSFQLAVADMYRFGRCCVESDLTKSLEWEYKASYQDYPEAHYRIAAKYYNYRKGGSKEDYSKALELYNKAAEQGHVLSQYELGLMYMEGIGVNQNFLQGKEWLCKANGNGYFGAWFMLGKYSLNCESKKRTSLLTNKEERF
jgi:TPR repeat protein/DNA replication protein DnaC